MGFFGTAGSVLSISLRDSVVKNSNFKNGFLYMDEYFTGMFNITNSSFLNNTSENGTILNILYLDEHTPCFVKSENSTYIGNRASKHGGVVNSMDNHAKLGDIIYIYSKDTSPLISDIEELEAIDGAIVTNPTEFILTDNSFKRITINSGDKIPNNITLFSAVILYLLREYPSIKGGGFEFLFIILIGSVINSIYVLFLTDDKTTTKCYYIYLFKNTGFSLVFGSIFVKSLRIYKIFHVKGTKKLGLSKKVMYIIVFSIALFHWFLAITWTSLNKMNIEPRLTNDYKEYLECKYPLSKNISTLFNVAVMFGGLILSYSIRRVDEKYKEDLGLTVYFYTLCTILLEMISNLEEIDIVIQDMADALGMIICMSVILYCLFIKKYLDIYHGNIKSSTRTLVNKNNNKNSYCNGSKDSLTINKDSLLNSSKNSLLNGSKDSLRYSNNSINNINNINNSNNREKSNIIDPYVYQGRELKKTNII
ncbi:hypothetical protein PIROE2DRAFT_60320 [Piromyces sp. E2]|nr:hypothetical protein PIROE2DRAFT_60320 [Piromyces sp. E2]|eukprot:OUM64963.1 hypothetical protein PIROE2DRAFT_60320 [Piromyces sp. E2]